MSGTITRLQFQQKTADRVNVYLDGQFAFGLPALEAARLRVGQHLSDADIDALHAVDQTQKAYDRAVRFLSYRPRSVSEVRRHLAQDGEDEATVEAVLGKLAEQGYLNDAEFARYWVDNRTQFRPKGPRALRQELRQQRPGERRNRHGSDRVEHGRGRLCRGAWTGGAPRRPGDHRSGGIPAQAGRIPGAARF